VISFLPAKSGLIAQKNEIENRKSLKDTISSPNEEYSVVRSKYSDDLQVIDPIKKIKHYELNGFYGKVSSLDFHPARDILAVGYPYEHIRLFNLNSGRIIKTLKIEDKFHICKLRFLQHGKKIAYIAESNNKLYYKLLDWQTDHFYAQYEISHSKGDSLLNISKLSGPNLAVIAQNDTKDHHQLASCQNEISRKKQELLSLNELIYTGIKDPFLLKLLPDSAINQCKKQLISSFNKSNHHFFRQFEWHKGKIRKKEPYWNNKDKQWYLEQLSRLENKQNNNTPFVSYLRLHYHNIWMPEILKQQFKNSLHVGFDSIVIHNVLTLENHVAFIYNTINKKRFKLAVYEKQGKFQNEIHVHHSYQMVRDHIIEQTIKNAQERNKYSYINITDQGKIEQFKGKEKKPYRICPESSKRILTKYDLYHYNKKQLRLIRNEIFADKGYIFKDTSMAEYFNNRDWYEPRTRKVPEINRIELYNVILIQKMEQSKIIPVKFDYTITKQFTESSYKKKSNDTVKVKYSIYKDSITEIKIINPSNSIRKNRIVKAIKSADLSQSRKVAGEDIWVERQINFIKKWRKVKKRGILIGSRKFGWLIGRRGDYNGLGMHLLYRSDKANGIEFSLMNEEGGYLNGISITLIEMSYYINGLNMSILGGETIRQNGLSLNGLAYSTDTLNGIMFSGLLGSTEKTNGILFAPVTLLYQFNGLNISPLLTIGDKSNTASNGLLLSPCVIDNTDKILNGAAISMFLIHPTLNGLSFGGLYNKHKGNGVATSIFYNKSSTMKGLEVSIINNSKNLKGAQLGLINKASSLNGFQIGLWNVVKENQKPFKRLPLINFNFRR
jgi:hypothetical protein